MSKPFSLLIGPEVYWVALYGILLVIIRLTHTPAKSMDGFLLSLPYIVPLILIPVSFGLIALSDAKLGWLILRYWIVSVIGCHYILDKGLSQHTTGGPGVGTAYIMGMIFAFVGLLAGTIFAVIKFK